MNTHCDTDTLEHHGQMNLQILALVTEHSPIASKLQIADISEALYVYDKVADTVVSCMKIAKANWYQADFTHLVVRPEFRRQGHGRSMIRQACEKAREMGLKLAQCTIRCDNLASMALFSAEGFRATNAITGLSGTPVSIWQKTL